jgi:hypothetical protein
VIVPCKDEARDLEATLTALANQTELNGAPLSRDRWEVVLLINNSKDESLAIAKRFRLEHPELALHVAECDFPAGRANVGHARRLLMDTACKRLSLNPKPVSVIASTDADTEVAPDWLAQNFAEFERGVGAVGGRISLHARDVRQLDEKIRRIHFLDDRYNVLLSWLEHSMDPQPHDSWPRHHQHFGASLAVTPETYRRVCGLPSKEALEDIAFYNALLRQDVPFRHSPDACVHTSARLRGKTPAGLAHQLSIWNHGPSSVKVLSVGYHTKFFALRYRFRSLWQKVRNGEAYSPALVTELARECGRPPQQLEGALQCRWFGAAFESLRLRNQLRDLPEQSLEEAVSQLQRAFFAGQNRPTDLSRSKLRVP